MAKLMVSLSGKAVQDNEKEILLHPNLAGVIFFKKNYESKEQLRRLCSELDAIDKIRVERGLPKLKRWIDHEGETVWRFKEGFTVLPTAITYGKLYDKAPKAALEKAEADGFKMASELMEFGIYSLAPVVDLHNPDSQIIAKYFRAFHPDPRITALIAEAFINGMYRAGMPVTLKHYPGHGSVVTDSHVDTAKDNRSKEEIEKDLYPFITLIKNGLADAIMPAHVIYPAFNDKAAGFSEFWLQKKLRQEYGFTGCVISDCVTMEGANIGSFLDRATAASKAGCDIVILCHQKPEVSLEVLNGMPETSVEAQKRIAQLGVPKKRVAFDQKEKMEPKSYPLRAKI